MQSCSEIDSKGEDSAAVTVGVGNLLMGQGSATIQLQLGCALWFDTISGRQSDGTT